MKNMSLDYQESITIVREISEIIENISSAAKVFRGNMEDVYAKSQLSFIKMMSDEMGNIETGAKNLTEAFDNIQEGLTRYVKEFEDYENDTTGYR